MTVVWIGDTVNTPLKAKYDTAASKTEELKNTLESRNIDTSNVDELYISLDTLTMNSLNTVSVAADKILNIANCFASVDPDTKSGLLDVMKNTISGILNGDILNSYIENIQNIMDNINNMTDSEINGAIGQIQNNTNTAVENTDIVINANSELSETTQEFSQAMGKAAALINCLDNAILEDTELGNNIEKIDPSLNGVISTIRQAKSEGKDKSAILKESNMVIASNLNLEDKYADVKNKMSSLI